MKKSTAILLGVAAVVGVLWAVGQTVRHRPAAGAPTNAPTAPAVEDVTWNYSEHVDDFRHTKYWFAEVTSDDVASLEFPYQEGASAILRLAQYDGGPAFDAGTLEITNGQIDCYAPSSSLCSLDAKFDDGEVLDLRGAKDDCGQHTCVRLSVYKDLLAEGDTLGFTGRLLKSKTFTVEVPFYRNGVRRFTFNTADLVWPRPGAPITDWDRKDLALLKGTASPVAKAKVAPGEDVPANAALAQPDASPESASVPGDGAE